MGDEYWEENEGAGEISAIDYDREPMKVMMPGILPVQDNFPNGIPDRKGIAMKRVPAQSLMCPSWLWRVAEHLHREVFGHFRREVFGHFRREVFGHSRRRTEEHFRREADQDL